MKRKVVGYILVLLLLTAVVVYGQDSFFLEGQITSADHEADEGYFEIGKDMTIMARPGTDLHAYLHNKVGQRVKITIESNYN